MVPRLAWLTTGVRREVVRQAAYPLLIVRVVEGLAAWLLFNEVFLAHARHPYPWLVHAGFVLYFVVNLLVALRYHAGRVLVRFLAVDLVGNLTPLALVIAASGGLASPIVLLLVLKMFAYAFVFGPECGIVAVAVGAGSLLAIGGLHALGVHTYVPISMLSPEIERRMNELVRALVLLIAGGGAIHFLRQTNRRETQLRQEMERARDAAERQRAAANVTGALLAVSEAVSRLTRLDEILEKVVEVVPRVLAVDYCSLFLWREDSGVYVGAAASGVEPAIAKQFTAMRLRPEEAPDLEWVRRLGHCAMVSPSSWQGLGVPEVPVLLIAPLLSGGQCFGVMQLARQRGAATFTQGDLKLADGVAGQTAVALERAELVEEGLRLLRAVESTGEAVLIADAQGRVRFVNAAFRRTFGYLDEPLIGRDTSCLTDQLPSQWLHEVTQAITTTGWHGEATARRRDGSEFPMLLDASLIRDEQGRVVGAVAILKDISDEKRLQEQLRRADRLAASGELAAGIAHEVNNALVGILVQAELAQSDAGVEELRTALARVDGQGRRIASIVRALLGFARPQVPTREPVEVPALVSETLALLDHELRRHSVAVQLHCPRALPPILADAKQIEQVLVNLFTNAVQAMAGSGGRLSIRASADGERLRLEISDTGPGIAVDHLGRIFDPFFTTKPAGSGLGLSVSYGIVRAHEGDLTARSEVGVGTTFTLTLPIAPRATASGLRTALVVDDEDQVADSLIALLEQEGLAAVRAASGDAALKLLAENAFDVVLLDVRLSDITGPEVFAQIKARQPAQAERVIFVTGGLWRSESRLQMHLPAQPVLSKPCTGTQLREALLALAVRPAA
ncbi:MAG TPA: ATP-binding protein [Candidatus Binatia bacterium]|nr:ATP-binding protein [Candidatus Binatia bacterium]